MIRLRIFNALRSIAESRSPNFTIGDTKNPYLRRWWVIPRNKIFNIYLHEFLRDDTDEALHDHPWHNLSWLLSGEYTEHTIAAGGIHHQRVMRAGNWKFRRASSAHRIALHNGPCWSLFITGPEIRQWGFHCTRGWVHWKVFTNTSNPKGSTVGRGCG